PGIPAEELLELMDETAKALDFLHRHEVIHRDIKPHNIFLVGGTAKVADFGLAKIVHQTVVSQSGHQYTPAYVAPEIVQGKATKASDQYSLAVSYCQLRTGRLPIEANDFVALIYAHVEKPPNLSAYDPEEAQVLERALAKEPEQRWPTCRDFVQALKQAVVSPAQVGPTSGSSSAANPIGEGGDEEPLSENDGNDTPKKTDPSETQSAWFGESDTQDLSKQGSKPSLAGNTTTDFAFGTETAQDAVISPSQEALTQPNARQGWVVGRFQWLVAVCLVGGLIAFLIFKNRPDSNTNAANKTEKTQTSSGDGDKAPQKEDPKGEEDVPVPVDVQLAQLKRQVNELDGLLKSSTKEIATLEVEVERLDEEIAKGEESLHQQLSEMVTLREKLVQAEANSVLIKTPIGEKTYSVDEIRKDLERRFQRYKSADASLELKRKTREQKGKLLAAQKEKYATLLDTKSEYETRIEELEAARAQGILKSSPSANLGEIDIEQIKGMNKLLEDINNQLKVEERLLETEGTFEEIRVNQGDKTDILDQILNEQKKLEAEKSKSSEKNQNDS
ncbi:MAG: protein kinase, partial [Planctomycetaceae bacterium]|nr:protein kinase [Planctomycetaceae bacterium]